MKTISGRLLNKTQKKLVAAAEDALATSYSPYSHLAVGAALLTDGGEVVTGSNVENAAYGSTICAERAALVGANAMGHRKFRAIAVIARGGSHGGSMAAPCGMCRQMLYEAARVGGCDIDVIISSADRKKAVVATISELLPLAFGPGLPVKLRRRLAGGKKGRA